MSGQCIGGKYFCSFLTTYTTINSGDYPKYTYPNDNQFLLSARQDKRGGGQLLRDNFDRLKYCCLPSAEERQVVQ